MLLSVCSAAPSCSSHLQVSFRADPRALLRKAIEDGHIRDGPSFCLKDGIHAQDISFKTHAARFIHSLVVEIPDASDSVDSSIFCPYPNRFDDILRGFPNEFTDSQPENLSCAVAERNALYPLTGDLKYVESSDMSGPKVLNEELVREITSGASSEMATTSTSENSVAITNTFNLNNEGSLNLKESVGNFFSEVTESVDRAQDTVKSSYTHFVSSFNGAVKNVSEYFDNAVGGLFSSAGNSKAQASNELTGLSVTMTENLHKTGTLATDILRRSIITVEDSLSNAVAFVVYSYGSAKSFLSPDLKDAINLSEEKTIQILRPVGDAIQQIYIVIEGFEKTIGLDPSDPIIPFLLFLGCSATIGITYWSLVYGGYSGDLDPELTLELLKNDANAILIDVRPEDLRERDGVPDLRRAARSKYASVTLPELDGALRKQLKGGKEVDDALIAVVVRNLKLVKNGSKVIVMDANGGRSKAIARSLKKLGVKNSYLVHGGFTSWKRKGLRVKELKLETVLTVLNEEAEAILEEIKPTPTIVIGFGLGILVSGYALVELEKTLQLIGIFGLGLTIYRRLASYEDSEDFKQDVRLLLAPVSLGAQAVSWAAGKLEPNKIGLPTSPSSTAVQDRVLKAAAKHESQPADDADRSQGLLTESSSQTNENLDLSEA